MDKFFSIVRGFGLKRGPQRWLGGVCGGIAAKLNVDVAYVRVAFLLFCLLPGPALVFYILAWLILPDQSNKIALESFISQRSRLSNTFWLLRRQRNNAPRRSGALSLFSEIFPIPHAGIEGNHLCPTPHPRLQSLGAQRGALHVFLQAMSEQT
jgi:phage shock protein PspC (stress-responsive transcriptional regulator)